jgi:clan AA aspartic protease (TIGR02281 family)
MRGTILTFGCLIVGAASVANTLLSGAGKASATTYVIIAAVLVLCALIATLPTLIERLNVVKSEARSIVTAVAMGVMALYTFDFSENFAFVASPADLAVDVASNGPSSSSIPRQADGHFRAIADVNGNNIPLLVDTGASIVLLTYDHAIATGLDMDALKFDLPILTANGRSHVAEVTLPALQIGDVSVKNVRAAVAERGQLHASLLGMSFIGNIKEAIIRKDEMIFRN